MHIGKRLEVPYVVEIAELSYSISLKNGCSVKISGPDLINFMERYVPDIDMTPYADFATQYRKRSQSIELLYAIRYVLDPITQPYLYSQMYDQSFDMDNNSSDRPRYEELKAAEMDNLLASLSAFYNSVKTGEKEKFRPIQQLSGAGACKWSFNGDVMTLADDDSMITLTESSVAYLTSHFRNDFIINGQENLQASSNGKVEFDKYVSLDYFIENFEQDIAKFKADGMTYEGFVDFLLAYKICEKYE